MVGAAVFVERQEFHHVGDGRPYGATEVEAKEPIDRAEHRHVGIDVERAPVTRLQDERREQVRPDDPRVKPRAAHRCGDHGHQSTALDGHALGHTKRHRFVTLVENDDIEAARHLTGEDCRVGKRKRQELTVDDKEDNVVHYPSRPRGRRPTAISTLHLQRLRDRS
jgi:hypothetical protein